MGEQPPKSNNASDVEIVDKTPRRLRRLARALSVCFVLLILTLSIFGRLVVTLFPNLKIIAPVAGLASITVLLALAYKSRGGTLRPRRSVHSVGVWSRTSLLTLSLLICCAYISELLIVDPIERIHFVKYGLLAVLLFLSQATSLAARKILAAVLLSASVGALDEALQFFVPNRVFDLRDLILNCTGALFGAIFLWLALLWKRLLLPNNAAGA